MKRQSQLADKISLVENNENETTQEVSQEKKLKISLKNATILKSIEDLVDHTLRTHQED